jgi:hypothetical protein
MLSLAEGISTAGAVVAGLAVAAVVVPEIGVLTLARGALWTETAIDVGNVGLATANVVHDPSVQSAAGLGVAVLDVLSGPNPTSDALACNTYKDAFGKGGGGGRLTYGDGYVRGEASALAGKTLVLGKFPGNVNLVARTPGTVTLDVPSGWTSNYNAGYIRGFLDTGGNIRTTSQTFTGTFGLEMRQVLGIGPGGFNE